MSDLFTLFTERLAARGIDYVVTGSVAVIIYGEPRLTHDIDLVVDLDDAAIEGLVAAFPDEEFYCPPLEVVQVEARRAQRGHFNIIHHESGFKADVYIAQRDPLHRWALSQRRTIPFGATTLQVAPPEYVIVRKLEYFREGGSEKHLRDIASMLENDELTLDREFVEREVEVRGLQAGWTRAQQPGRLQ